MSCSTVSSAGSMGGWSGCGKKDWSPRQVVARSSNICYHAGRSRSLAMSNVEKISIALPSEMIEDIKEAVDRGDYATTSEVLRDAVRDWQRREVVRRYENLRPKSLADLKRMVREGIDSLDRGERIPAEDVYAELTARFSGKARRQKRR